jgi:hypothetical protein
MNRYIKSAIKGMVLSWISKKIFDVVRNRSKNRATKDNTNYPRYAATYGTKKAGSVRKSA